MTIVTGKAEQCIWCQRNSRTVKIRPNDRFLFGTPEQRIGFRVYANGFGNSLNTVTGDDNSPTLTEFYMEGYEINYEEDDIISGFANAERYKYSIDISENNTYFELGAKSKFNATVYKGKNVVKEKIIWHSIDEEIIRVCGNEFEAVGVGTTKIYAMMADNKEIYGSMMVTVQGEELEDEYNILISPDINYILERETLTVNVDLYKNGIKQDTPIEIRDVSIDVPRRNYKLIADENSFTITNFKKFLDSPVKVSCIYNDVERIFEFTLRGLY